jgi:CRP-like cAMP-binding protein
MGHHRAIMQGEAEHGMTALQGQRQALIAKLERRDRVPDVEKRALGALLDPPHAYAAGAFIVSPGERPQRSTLLLAGVVARQNLMMDGSGSFTQLNIAGDFVDLHSLLMEQMDHGVVAITDCVVATAPHQRIVEMIAAHPHLGRLLWLDTVIDGAIHRQWLHRMARQTALGRMAHLICEMEARCAVVGLADDEGFDLPLSQGQLADCLGLSAVHANRTLMELRRLELVEWRGARVRILDRERLEAVAEFDPTYLRLQSAPV